MFRWGFIMAVVLGSVAAAGAADWRDFLEKRTQTDDGGAKLPYRLMKPDGYDAKTKYPLVIFLHGAGERGTDNDKQLVHGVKDFASDENRKKYPCFLVAPQCPTSGWWVGTSKAKTEPLKLVFDVIEATRKEFSIDDSRIYITGLSMGGYGTWAAIARKPDLFAAAVPICGGGDPKAAAKVAKIPIWAFHGAKDGVVKPEQSRDMIAALKKAGGDPKYTEYPDAGHDSWTATYADPKVHEWLFAQKKK
jgi:predicted peptidase